MIRNGESDSLPLPLPPPPPPTAPWRKWTYHHVIVFVLTYFGYALFHATRKTFSNVKTVIQEEWVPENVSKAASDYLDHDLWNKHTFVKDMDSAESFLGQLDTVFMTSYAFGLFLSGYVADRLNMRKVLGTGMCLSALSMIFFGVISEWLEIYDKAYYIFFWILNGLFQSVGWPVTVTIVENWFGKSSRGLMFGFWGSCPSVGNIMGAYLTIAVLDYGYEFAFLVSASVLFAGGIVMFFCLVPSPKDVGLPLPDEEPVVEILQPETHHTDDDDDELLDFQNPAVNVNLSYAKDDIPISVDPTQDKAVTFLQALLLPGVIPYSLAYACLKLVNYSFFFWLPFYLKNKFHWSDTLSDQLSTYYDVGGIIGAIVSGVFTDLMGRRSPVVMVMLIISPFTLYFYSVSSANLTVNILLMVLCGLFIGAVANILSTAIAADLGRQESLQGNSRALATVTGIIDGTGSVGAAVGQLAVPALNISYGWDSVFILFIVMICLTAVFIIPITYRDVKYYIEKCRSRRRSSRDCSIIDASDVNRETDNLLS